MPRPLIWQTLRPVVIALLVLGSIAVTLRFFLPSTFTRVITTIHSLSPPIQAVIVFISITGSGGFIKTFREYRQARHRLTNIDSSH